MTSVPTPTQVISAGSDGTGNAVAAIGIGIYCALAVVKGNGPQLWTLIQGETGFIKWGIAVALLWWLATLPEFRQTEIGPALISIIVLGIGFTLVSNPTIINSVKTLWNALPNAAATT